MQWRLSSIGRDTFIITDRQSPKFCNKISSPIVEKDSEGRAKGWDFRMVSKQSRTWTEEKDYEFDIWLNLRPSSTVKGLRLIVTPFRKSCSEQDVRIQRYSHCNNDVGRCHNTELFCKQLVKCGTLDQESWDRACTEQFKESDGMQLPLAIIVAVFCDRHHLPRPRRQVALPALLWQPGRLQQHRHQ